MGKYETVRHAISTINGGQFQALASRYVRFKYHIECSFDLGMSAGSTKTASGTPDSFLIRPNGHLIFVECGHISDHHKALEKLSKDVQACLDKEQLSLAQRGITLDKIVCCFSHDRFEPDELASILALDDRVTLIGPDELASACCECCPWLAEEYLGVPLGTGSFLDVDAFLRRNDSDGFAPSMRQTLSDREEEARHLAQLIDENQAVLVSGSSGCGKTKLCLEVCKGLAASRGMDLYVVPSTGADLYEDLVTYCAGCKPVMLLLDDANELAGLRAIVDYVLERPHIKLVVTTRTYAKERVEEELRRLRPYRSYRLERLPAERINKIVGRSYESIGTAALSRIATVSRGNLRLAFLAVEAAREDLTSIRSIESLVSVAYRNKLNALDDSERKAIAIASLLGPHRTKDNANLQWLLSQLRLPTEEYREACVRLHERELMDVAEDFEAVSFEEQNLRDFYLFHALVTTKDVRVMDLWQLQGGRGLCVRSCQIVSDVYGNEHTMEILKAQAIELLDSTSGDERLRVVETFGPLLGTRGIVAADGCVRDLQLTGRSPSTKMGYDFAHNYSQGSLSTPALAAVTRFLESPEHTRAAVSLVFDVLRGLDVPDGDLDELFQRRLNVGWPAARPHFEGQSDVLDLLTRGDLSADGSTEAVGLILFAKGLFRDEVSHACQSDWRRFKFIRYPLRYSEELIDLRKRCLDLLCELYPNRHWKREIERTVLSYMPCLDGDPALGAATTRLIRDAFLSQLAMDSFETCELVALFLIQHADRWEAQEKPLETDSADVMNARAQDACDYGASAIDALAQLVLSKAQKLAVETVVAAEGARRWGHASRYERVLRLASTLSPTDWEEFFLLLQDDRQTIRCGYKLERILAECWNLGGLGDDVTAVIAKGYVSSCLSPGSFAEDCCAYYFERFGLEEGRNALAVDAGSKRAAWLARYDAYAIGRGHVPEVAQAVSWLTHDREVLPFASVCAAERSRQGFFKSYVETLAKSLEQRECIMPYLSYLPYEVSELKSEAGEACELACNREALEHLACVLYRTTAHGVSDDVPAHLLTHDLRTVPDLVDAHVHNSNSRDVAGFELCKRVVELAPLEEVLNSLGEVLSDGAEDAPYTYHQRRMVLKLLLLSADEAGGDAEVDSWVAQAVIDKSHPLCSVTRGVIASFSEERRLGLVLALAEKGIDVEGFVDVALG